MQCDSILRTAVNIKVRRRLEIFDPPQEIGISAWKQLGISNKSDNVPTLW